jgi:hypothetical protein
MSMYFLDETDDWPEYKIVRDEINQLDIELLELQRQLQEAESGLQSQPENDDVKAGIRVLKKKLQETEEKLNESLRMYR